MESPTSSLHLHCPLNKNMENLQFYSDQTSTFSPSTLLCKEAHLSFDEEGIDKYSSSINAFDDEEEKEYVKLLFDKEISSAEEVQIQSRSISIKDARFDAIQYIVHINTIFGFKLLTAYISITYLDTFLSRRHIDVEKAWAIRLVAMACLSLAAKLEECTVPSLSEFPMEEYYFESRVIQRMELLILSTLEWKMIKITPFPFVPFLIPRLWDDSPPENIKPKIFELIFSLINVVNLMCYKEAVIAAAMTLMALDPRLSRESMENKLHGLASCLPLNIEEVWSCYKEMKGLDTERLNKPSKLIVSPPLSPTQFPNTNTLEYPSSSTPAIGSKRKRLGFNECDQNSDNIPLNDKKKRQN